MDNGAMGCFFLKNLTGNSQNFLRTSYDHP
jgi:hypothetical protein